MLQGSYDYRLVTISVVLAVFAAYAALDLAGRVTATQHRARLFWLAGGATAMGMGIWAMHYIGMLAFELPIPVLYHYPTVIVSLLAAIGASAVALYTVSRERMNARASILGSAMMGGGIAAMHYIGMAAMRLPASMEYRAARVTLSVVLAVAISWVALVLTFRIGHEDRTSVRKLFSALLMGAAIPLMHYTGMWAVVFTNNPIPVDCTHTVRISWLGAAAISMVSLLAMLLSIVTAFLDRLIGMHAEMLRAARESEMQFRTLAEAIPQIVWTSGPDGQTTFISRRWYEMTGIPAEGSLGTGWMNAVHPDDHDTCQKKWEESLRTGEPFEIEYRLHDARKGFRWYLDRAIPMRDASGTIVKWFGTCTDIDDQMQTQELLQEQIKQHTAALFEANERLQHESIHDPLTGLYNRRYLEDTMEREARRSVRALHGLSVIMFDLDHFKKFNDTYGHDAGDAVLRETGALLARSVRGEDIVCRYGGEEFVIILPMADFKTGCARAQRIRDRVRELNVLHQGQPLGRITISGGVAALPEHGVLPKELLQAADAALYRAKREGRDRIVGAASAAENASPEMTVLVNESSG